jgi:hypothetical protein
MVSSAGLVGRFSQMEWLYHFSSAGLCTGDAANTGTEAGATLKF